MNETNLYQIIVVSKNDEEQLKALKKKCKRIEYNSDTGIYDALIKSQKYIRKLIEHYMDSNNIRRV